MSKQQKITQEQFELKSIKFKRKDGEIEIDWEETISDGGATHKIPANKTLTFNPQPRLIALLDKMNVYLSRTNNYPHTPAYAGKIVVNGVHISGDEKAKKVILTGQMKADNKGNINVISPLINLKNDIFHMESDLFVDLEELEKETWGFVFDGLRGQLSIKGLEETEEDNQLSLITDEEKAK